MYFAKMWQRLPEWTIIANIDITVEIKTDFKMF